MGSERRLLAMLDGKGIIGDEAWETKEAIETLTSAGDDFSDAIYSWTDLENPAEALERMRTALGEAEKAVGVLTKVIENEKK